MEIKEHTDLNDYYSNTATALSILLILSGVVILFYNLIVLNLSFLIIAESLIILVSAILILSRKLTKLRYTAIILLLLVIDFVSAFPQIGLSILFMEPIFLSFYTEKKKFIISIGIIQMLMFPIIKNVSSIINYSLLSVQLSLESPSWIMITLRCMLELGFTSLTLIPCFICLLNKNEKLNQAIKEKEKATDDILQFCSTATAYHDKYLTVHIQNVRDIAAILLSDLKKNGYDISDEYYNQIVFSVQFHDIGKIYIDAAILEKNGKLSSEEYTAVKEHPQKGYELFSMLPDNVLEKDQFEICRNVIVQHHERMDGTGYPNQLTADQISFEAKIVAISDVVDALLSWRTYKKPMTWEKMCEVIEKDHQQFDKDCIAAVLRCKEKILKVSDANNLRLISLMNINNESIIRE